MSRPASPLIAFAVASLGIAIFSSMDAVMKGLVLALGAYNALTWRTMAGIVASGVPYALSRPKRPSREAMRLHLVRAAVSAVMAFLFFWGLGRVPMEVSFYQSLFISIAFLVAAPWLLELPAVEHVPALAFAAILATASLFLLSWAYARAEANYLAPTEYTGFLWATLWGWVVFGESVSFFTVAGAALIVGGCIIAARRRDHAPVADTEAQI